MNLVGASNALGNVTDGELRGVGSNNTVLRDLLLQILMKKK